MKDQWREIPVGMKAGTESSDSLGVEMVWRRARRHDALLLILTHPPWLASISLSSTPKGKIPIFLGPAISFTKSLGLFADYAKCLKGLLSSARPIPKFSASS